MLSKAIPLCIRKLVVRDVQNGESHRAVAKKYSISKAAVGKILLKLKTFGSVVDRPGRGRKRKTDARTDTKIMREVKKNPKVTVREIQETLQLSVSGRTVRRRLVAQGLNSKLARKRPFISKANKAKRLKFAKEHADKPLEFWKTVLWTDESKFELFNRKRRVRVWCRSGEELQERHIQGTMKHGGGNVMVWGCFSWGGVGSIVKIDGIMTADSYINILRENLEVSLIQTGLEEKFVFQQDNDPKHTAKKTKSFFRSCRIKPLEWPPQSPDLNPIENLWAILDARVDKTGVTNKNNYFEALERAWEELDPQHLKNLVESMSKRLQEVLKAKGGHINY